MTSRSQVIAAHIVLTENGSSHIPDVKIMFCYSDMSLGNNVGTCIKLMCWHPPIKLTHM